MGRSTVSSCWLYLLSLISKIWANTRQDFALIVTLDGQSSQLNAAVWHTGDAGVLFQSAKLSTRNAKKLFIKRIHSIQYRVPTKERNVITAVIVHMLTFFTWKWERMFYSSRFHQVYHLVIYHTISIWYNGLQLDLSKTESHTDEEESSYQLFYHA